MTGRETDRVNHLFAGNSTDVAPPPAGHAAHVLYSPVLRDPEVSSLCASVLSDDELNRAARFASEDDRILFRQRRAFRRYCGARALGSQQPLSKIQFSETDNGRPYLPTSPGLWFSFSCCRIGMLGAWSMTHGVGVDIEDSTRSLEAAELAHRFFSDAEAEVVASLDGSKRLQTFYRLWTLKEAALKSIGEGLPYGLDAFEFELTPVPRVIRAPVECGGPVRFDASLIEGTGSCAALVVRGMG